MFCKTILLIILIDIYLVNGFHEFNDYQSVCGQYNTSLETAEIFYQFPWFVSIYLSHADYPSLIHASSGTLISKDLILAPESVFKGESKPHFPDTFVVFVGESANLARIQSVQSRSIKEIISNPENQKLGAYTDFVLLRLNAPVEFNDHVSPICLCHENSNYCELRPDQMGYTMNAEPVWTPAIRCPKTFHRKSRIEKTICASHLHQQILSNFSDIDHGLNTMICAEFSDSACNHKTRSGLYVKLQDDRWYLKGVDYIPTKPFSDHFTASNCPKHISLSSNVSSLKNDSNKFTGFVDISKLTNWIQSHM